MEKYNLDALMEFGDQFTLKRLADVPETQINLVCLPPKQALPAHNANSNVRLLVLQGELALTVSGEQAALGRYEIAAVQMGTPMRIANESDANAAFLVIKTPNPESLK